MTESNTQTETENGVSPRDDDDDDHKGLLLWLTPRVQQRIGFLIGCVGIVVLFIRWILGQSPDPLLLGFCSAAMTISIIGGNR